MGQTFFKKMHQQLDGLDFSATAAWEMPGERA
jgi:hypothetical protein